jgi:hypothetical protein
MGSSKSGHAVKWALGKDMVDASQWQTHGGPKSNARPFCFLKSHLNDFPFQVLARPTRRAGSIPALAREERSTSGLAAYLSNGLAVKGKACGVRLVPFE